MPKKTGILLSNVTVTTPVTSPSTNLSAVGGDWTATLDTTAHAGSECDFTIQSSLLNSEPWNDVSKNSFVGGDGVGKFGSDLSRQIQTFTLYGDGPFWRINVTRVVGTILVNSLSVSNTSA